MNYHIVTTQPDIYDSFLKTGLIGRGIERQVIEIKIHNLHDFAFDAHRSVDDTPAGGGPGMILRVDVMAKAIEKIQSANLKFQNDNSKCKIILLTPQGDKFNQKTAKRLAKNKNLILISGRFEGYDERIRDLVDEEISIGNYVLTAGDLPAMVLIDAISRQIPGFIEKSASISEESFENGLLEYPQYTRPNIFNLNKIPEILLSGNHGKIAQWRKSEALKRTKKRRPDLS